jgi:mRNA interferase MazF
MDTIKKDFQGWCKKKEILHFKSEDAIPYFNERELWWCALGVNIGFEQDGKNENFERPILILRKFNKHLLLALPQTSKAKQGKFFYKVTRDAKEYFLILSQVRVISSKRLLRKLGMIPEYDFDQVKKQVRDIAFI